MNEFRKLPIQFFRDTSCNYRNAIRITERCDSNSTEKGPRQF